MERARALRLLSVSLCLALAVGYLGVDAYMLSLDPRITFLVAENLLWLTLYLALAYASLKGSRYRALLPFVAGVNAGRVSRSIVDPYGALGGLLAVHASLFFLLVLTALIGLAEPLAEGTGPGR